MPPLLARALQTIPIFIFQFYCIERVETNYRKFYFHSGAPTRADIIRGFVASGHEVTVFTRKVDVSLYEATLVKTVKINTSFLPKRFRDFYVSNLLPSLRKKHPVDVMLGCCRSRHVDIVICGGTHPGFL